MAFWNARAFFSLINRVLRANYYVWGCSDDFAMFSDWFSSWIFKIGFVFWTIVQFWSDYNLYCIIRTKTVILIINIISDLMMSYFIYFNWLPKLRKIGYSQYMYTIAFLLLETIRHGHLNIIYPVSLIMCFKKNLNFE